MRITGTGIADSESEVSHLNTLTAENNASDPSVAILMCTYNGARYLREQLNSFSEQTCTRWTVFVSDDASTDETLNILAEFQQKWGKDRLILFKGPCEGFARNFISLVQKPEINADFFAFSDQDDIWFADKLARSIDCLKHVPKSKPALYCSRTRLIDADKKIIGLSPLFSKPPAFKNALVQSLAGANTMLINYSARDLLLKLPEHSSPVSHDWLTYLIVSGCDGEVVYDARPTLDYRQHGGNLIGAKTTNLDKLKRVRGMFSGRFAQWNDRNLDILNKMKSLLSEENQKVLTRFEGGRNEKFFKRLIAFSRTGVYRQTSRENLILLVAILLGRI